MKNRLTNRAENGFVYCTQCCINENKDCVEQDCFRAILNRLAAYEDSGLLPEDCAAYAKAEKEKRIVVFENYEHLKEIQELANAKAEGRLVMLPCHLGDKIWFNLNGYINYGYAKWFETDEHGAWTVAVINPPQKPTFLWVDDFGKTAFLTREEAEKAIGGKEDA